jgi:hypothetical protein
MSGGWSFGVAWLPLAAPQGEASFTTQEGARLITIRSRFWRAGLVVGVVGLGALLASPAAMAAPGGTGHTVTITENIHGIFDPGVEGPNPCSGADLVSVDASGNLVNHITFFPDGG